MRIVIAVTFRYTTRRHVTRRNYYAYSEARRTSKAADNEIQSNTIANSTICGRNTGSRDTAGTSTRRVRRRGGGAHVHEIRSSSALPSSVTRLECRGRFDIVIITGSITVENCSANGQPHEHSGIGGKCEDAPVPCRATTGPPPTMSPSRSACASSQTDFAPNRTARDRRPLAPSTRQQMPVRSDSPGPSSRTLSPRQS